MKQRLLYYEIQKHVAHKNALVITGMRQVGKTTLLRQIFDSLGDKPKLWFDFDNPLDQKLFEDVDYNVIYRRLVGMSDVKDQRLVGMSDLKGQRLVGMSGVKGQRLHVFLDEIQNFPEVTKIIKYLMDHYGVKFFVTGSAGFYLKNLFPESLSGRKFLYVLPPLSFKEYLYFKDFIGLEEARRHDLEQLLSETDIFLHKKYEVAYEDYIRWGGFPEVVTTEDLATKTEVLRNIFASFFEKDLRLLSDYADIRQLRDLILLLVPRVGSMLDITKLADELRLDRPKVYSFLEFLQGTFMITLLPKFSRSIDRSVAAGRKVYFNDTGLLLAIGQVNDGQLFENAVANQLAAYGELSFYNKKNTAEIDFVLNKEIAFEAKLSGTAGDLQKLQKLATDLKLGKSYVLSKTRYNTDIAGITSAVNLWAISHLAVMQGR